MTTPLTERPSLDDWQVMAMRVTLFAAPQSLPFEAKDWWRTMTGVDPQQSTEQRHIAARMDEGPFLGGGLVLSVQAQRISWELRPLLEVVTQQPGLPVLGAYPKVRDAFTEAVNSWLPQSPDLIRMAFGCQLLLPTKDRDESYHRLAKLLSLPLDPRKARDFQYRINRQRQSTSLPDMEINRLQTWSAMFYHFGIGIGDQQPVRTSEKYACLLDLDINTIQERIAPLPRSTFQELQNELVELASEIVLKGDVP